ncbi:hypothetical protein CPB84DRAFT_1751976 [Gymnopilus junonius]|uniref:Uncharacterized protein n=1 Tax=Gymnopilus junonius TaxID=109634 RepID=A0A9P5NDB4_GYMJU|nr:hypothetical protein CPB84DRAFT_1751976 [Gymnopilus junonius]
MAIFSSLVSSGVKMHIYPAIVLLEMSILASLVAGAAVHFQLDGVPSTPTSADAPSTLAGAAPSQHLISDISSTTPEDPPLLTLPVMPRSSRETTDDDQSQETPSVAFVAFYNDIEHEVSVVTAGYRVTLTYNLYFADQPLPSTTLGITLAQDLDPLRPVKGHVRRKESINIDIGSINLSVHVGSRKMAVAAVGGIRQTGRQIHDIERWAAGGGAVGKKKKKSQKRMEKTWKKEKKEEKVVFDIRHLIAIARQLELQVGSRR